MVKASNEFIEALNADRADFKLSGTITFKDGQKVDISDADVWENGLKLEDATSSDTVFTIGAFVNTKLTLIINNQDDEFSSYDFDGATISPIRIGLKLSKGMEWLDFGIFTVMKPTYNGSLITLSCQDNGAKFSKDFDASVIDFPATLATIARSICKLCLGSADMLESADFPNSSYVVKKTPQLSGKMTYGDIIACIAQMAGCYAKIDKDGKLYFSWYGSEIKNTQLDGGTFSTTTTPYSDGDAAYGGTYAYNDGDTISGGTFEQMSKYHVINSFQSFTIGTDNFTISKVKVLEEFIESEDNHKGYAEYPSGGSDDYVVEISGNPLIEQGEAATVAQMIGDQVIGITFRPMNCSILSNPLIEAGDIAYLLDRKNKLYLTFISSRSYTVGEATNISCAGQTASQQGLKAYTETEKAIAKTEERVDDTNTRVDEVNQTIADNEAKTSSRFEKTDASIVAEVTRATEAEGNLSSRITQTADSVSSKVSKNELISEINQSAEAITLSAGRLIMTSGNFTIDTSGNVSMTGSVNSDNGKIGGFVIGKEMLYGGTSTQFYAGYIYVWNGGTEPISLLDYIRTLEQTISNDEKKFTQLCSELNDKISALEAEIKNRRG